MLSLEKDLECVTSRNDKSVLIEHVNVCRVDEVATNILKL